MRRTSALLLGVVMLAGPRAALAGAEPPSAVVQGVDKDAIYKRLLTAALELYRLEKWTEAISLLRQAQELRAAPELLLNLGRCYEALAQHREALSAYQRYLIKAEGASVEKRRELNQTIERLERLVALEMAASQPAPAPPPSPRPRPKVVDLVTHEQVPRSRPPGAPFYRRPWFLGLVSTVAAGAVLGGVLAGTKPWDRVPGDLNVDPLQR